jgi:hypothetical protein
LTRRRFIGLAAFVLAALVFAAIGMAALGHLAGRGSRAVQDPTLLAAISHVAHEAAAAQGEPVPGNGLVVASTRDAANDVANGANLPDSSDVYVVTLHGNFRATHAGPFGAPPNRGRVLTLVLRASDLVVVDLTIANAAPDLGRLGPATALP